MNRIQTKRDKSKHSRAHNEVIQNSFQQKKSNLQTTRDSSRSRRGAMKDTFHGIENFQY